MKRLLILLLLLIPCIMGADLKVYTSPLNLSQGAMGYYYGDEVTQVHEDTHGLNSKLRNKYGGNCFYLWRNEEFVHFSKTPPGITLYTVARNCKYKGGIYNLYLVQSRRDWNDTPLYVYDEWVAYTNSAAQRIWVGASGRTTDSDMYYMFEMGYYSYVAMKCMPDSYKDKEALQQFWVLHMKRNIIISDAARQKNVFSETHRKWRELMEGILNAEINSTANSNVAVSN